MLRCFGALRGWCGTCGQSTVLSALTVAAQQRSVGTSGDRRDALPTPSTSDSHMQHSWEPRARRSPVLRNMRLDVPESLAELIPPLEPRAPSPHSLRTGLIAVKAGMVSEWDEHGVLTPFTVLWFDDNQVTQVKAQPFDVTTALQVGCGSKKAKRLSMKARGLYLKQGLPFKSKLVEFKVSPDALLPVGTKLSAAHFVAGQFVDVTGITKGKGFQGVMKRWGFKGQGASHGVSLKHRSPGSIGSQGYARVVPGKKMAGRMGGERRLQRNIWVYRKRGEETMERPFPTHIGDLPEPTQAKPIKNMYDAYKD